jgi:hypothetical protein
LKSLVDVPGPSGIFRDEHVGGLKKPFLPATEFLMFLAIAGDAFFGALQFELGVCVALKPAPIAALSRRAFTMKKTISALLAIATVAGSLATAMPDAKADGGRIAAGVAGGLIGGALLGGAIAASRPAYAAPAPVYVEEPACRVVRERFFDEYQGRWRSRPVQVCD